MSSVGQTEGRPVTLQRADTTVRQAGQIDEQYLLGDKPMAEFAGKIAGLIGSNFQRQTARPPRFRNEVRQHVIKPGAQYLVVPIGRNVAEYGMGRNFT